MTNSHLSACPICQQTSILPYLTCVDYYASGEKFELVQCKNCGFALTQDFPSENSIGKYYDVPNYISHSDTQEGAINKLYHFARKMSLKSKAKMILKFSRKKTGSLLDVGSGTGYFLNEMKRRNWSVTGIEKDEGAKEYAKTKFDIDTQSNGYLFRLSAKKKDVITLWHVLEHIENLNDTLAQLHSILKDDGTLFIALPNRNSYDAKAYKEYWAAYDVPRHLWHFSPSDFEILANKHNFRLIATKPMHFDVFYISMLSERYKQTAFPTLVGLIKGGFYFIGNLFNKKRCSSLIYILKKKE